MKSAWERFWRKTWTQLYGALVQRYNERTGGSLRVKLYRRSRGKLSSRVSWGLHMRLRAFLKETKEEYLKIMNKTLAFLAYIVTREVCSDPFVLVESAIDNNQYKVYDRDCPGIMHLPIGTSVKIQKQNDKNLAIWENSSVYSRSRTNSKPRAEVD